MESRDSCHPINVGPPSAKFIATDPFLSNWDTRSLSKVRDGDVHTDRLDLIQGNEILHCVRVSLQVS